MNKTTVLLVSGLLCGTIACVQANPLKQVPVGPYDTAPSIAYDNGITTRALIEANGLTPPYYSLEGRKTLLIPAPNEYVVGQEKNLDTIAKQNGVKVDALVQTNNITPEVGIKPGDVLILPPRDTEPEADRPMAPIVTNSLAPLPLIKIASPSQGRKGGLDRSKERPLSDDIASELRKERKDMDKPPPSDSKPEAPKKKLVLSKEGPDSKKKEKKKVSDEKKEPKPKSENTFAWPADGPVIKEFGAGGKNDGINIELPVGSDVKASAAGEVMYAGSSLKELGQLLLIKHEGGWVTAYAHLSEFQVAKGDKVKKGQVIALSGKTGAAKQPQLHFEILKGKKPIDPLGKLGAL